MPSKNGTARRVPSGCIARSRALVGSLIVICAADPLNLIGIITPGERIRAVGATRIAYRNGIPVSLMEGEYVRPLTDLDESAALTVAAALAGRRVAAGSGWVGTSR